MNFVFLLPDSVFKRNKRQTESLKQQTLNIYWNLSTNM